MTVRHYYTDAYRAEFTAAIVERSGDGTRVYLDETAFYPTSGGQPHDVGTLGGVAVVDVVDEDDRIAHVLAAPLGAAAEPRLVGRIDWVRRYDHMQQHTGQHLLSAVFEDLFGAKTVSVHFGPDYVHARSRRRVRSRTSSSSPPRRARTNWSAKRGRSS